MKLQDICSYLDLSVPLSFQEDYDNSGLQIGQPSCEVNSAMVTLDVTEEVVNEAVAEKCDLIVSHHPLIFKGLKRLTDRSFTERIVLNAIKNNIAIYSAHTNLDMMNDGVSFKMAQKLGLTDLRVLAPLKNQLLKLVTFIPESHLDKVREAVYESGAGVTGNYDKCGFCTPGTGSFRAGENTNPFAGEKGKVHLGKEIRFETVLYSYLKDKVIQALIDAHPYEEVAYDIYSLENENYKVGLGCVGELPSPLSESNFLNMVSGIFGSKGIRYSSYAKKTVKRIAMCGGAGAALLGDAIALKADAFITGDIKYHNFFDAANNILLIDCGHYETEKFSTEILYDLIIKKFPKFAVRFSKTNTNPINYL